MIERYPIYNQLLSASQADQGLFAILIDPDRLRLKHLAETIRLAEDSAIDLFFVGGSLLLDDMLDETVRYIKKHTNIPVVLFPGNSQQINKQADAILLLSLISGRNPDLLIGQQVRAAPYLYKSNLELISTGYMLIDGGVPTSVSYMSNTSPIPRDKSEIAISTALAGQQLGLKTIYLDAGSGAKYPVSQRMINQVKKYLDIPLIVGGGIKTAQSAHERVKAGANIIVVGNAIEKNPILLSEISQAIHQTVAEI